MRSRHEILESLLRNTASNAVASGCSIALEILTFAVLVRLLAPADYGMYIMAAGLAGHFAIVELGVGRSIERFLPEFVVQGRRDDVPRAVAFAMACHGALGAFAALSIAAAAAAGAGGWLVGDAPERMTSLLFVAALFALPSWSLRALGSVLVALDAMPREALVVAAAAFLRALWLIAGAALGVDVVGLLVGSGVVELLAGLLRFAFARRVFGALLLRVDDRFLPVGRELFGYSLWVGVQRAALAISNGLDRLLVGALLGPASVPVYWLCMRIVRLAPGALGAIAKRAVLPIASELRASGGTSAYRALVLRGTRAYTAFIWALVAVLFLHAAPLLALLGGEDTTGYAWVVQTSLAVMALVIARGVLLQAGLAHTAVARDAAAIAVVLSVLHVGLLLAAGRVGGVAAAILAWSAAHALVAPFWAQRVAERIELPVRRYWLEVLRGGWPAVVVVLVLTPVAAGADAHPLQLGGSVLAASLVALAAAVFAGLDGDLRGQLFARMAALRPPRRASSVLRSDVGHGEGRERR